MRKNERGGDGVNEKIKKLRHSRKNDCNRNAIRIDLYGAGTVSVRLWRLPKRWSSIRITHNIPPASWTNHFM